uniref:Uncharacterized protein n=1 Tax=Vitis vinifera TaxID=29760 RepID=F6GYJ3_VITVI
MNTHHNWWQQHRRKAFLTFLVIA